MTIALLVMTDGRDDLLAQTVGAWGPVLHHPLVTEWWMHDDTGDRGHIAEIERRYGVDSGAKSATAGPFMVTGGHKVGFGGAIGRAWSRMREVSAARYVLHLEDDFLLSRPLDLVAIVRVMDSHPHLTQMALRRQAWSPAERRAGGIVEQHPDAYTEVRDGDDVWLEHRRFWTTNPSIYRRSLCARGWPIGLESEGHFGIALWASDPSLRSAYWGARDSGVWCEHIGRDRVGVGY